MPASLKGWVLLQVPWVTPEEPYFHNHGVLPGELIINCGSSCLGRGCPWNKLSEAFNLPVLGLDGRLAQVYVASNPVKIATALPGDVP